MKKFFFYSNAIKRVNNSKTKKCKLHEKFYSVMDDFLATASVCQGPTQPLLINDEIDNITYLQPWISIENFHTRDYTFTVPSSGLK